MEYSFVAKPGMAEHFAIYALAITLAFRVPDDSPDIGLHCAFANPAARSALTSGKSIMATKPQQTIQ
jgi:hypothetical protein